MHRAAVLGSPVGHSLSPVLHEAGYAAAGLTGWTYGRHEVLEHELAPFVERLDEGWRGLSLTMPLKEVAFEVAVTVSDLARQARAVNTLTRRPDGGWDGSNTDVGGIVSAVGGVDHRGRVTILGSGATARSAVLAAARLGAGEVLLAARNHRTVEDLAALAREVGLTAYTQGLEGWAADPGGLVISTLPLQASTAAAELVTASAAPVTLLDVVYAGWPTPLARAAAAVGYAVVSGLEMLVHQAAEQFRLFTGVEPDVDAMMAAGREALGR